MDLTRLGSKAKASMHIKYIGNINFKHLTSENHMDHKSLGVKEGTGTNTCICRVTTRHGSMLGQLRGNLSVLSVLWAVWTLKAPNLGLGSIYGVTKPRWIWGSAFLTLQTRNRDLAKKHPRLLYLRNVLCDTPTCPTI